MTRGRLWTTAFFIAAAASIARADDPVTRRVPFWPDEIPAAIRGAIDGRAALETVRDLGRYHRVHGSPGFAAAAEMMRAKAEAGGLSHATVEHFPADGHTTYAHFRSYLGWDPKRRLSRKSNRATRRSRASRHSRSHSPTTARTPT